MTEKLTDVGIVLVGINARDYIRGCVESIHKAQWRGYTYRIVYIDNGSKDDTCEMLARDFPEVIVRENGRNVGYCPAANQGARLIACRHLMFLNDDTLVLDDAIAKLVEFADRSPQMGTIGSRLFFPDMTEQWSGRRFPRAINALLGRRSLLTKLFPNHPAVKKYLCKDELQGSEPFAVDWVSAAAQLFPADAFWSVGGFAEDYYYWHEAVVSDRLARKGLKTYLHPQSRIIHYEGKGSGARPHRVRVFHIKNFHHGAYRCFCEHYQLGKANPIRFLIFAALMTRAGLMLCASWLKSLRETPPPVAKVEPSMAKQ